MLFFVALCHSLATVATFFLTIMLGQTEGLNTGEMAEMGQKSRLIGATFGCREIAVFTELVKEEAYG